MSKGNLWGALLAASMLQACATAGAPSPSPAQLDAAAHSRRGVRAAVAGDRERALAEFAAAEKVSASVEDSEGVAVAKINSARLLRLSGQLAQAHMASELALKRIDAQSPIFAEAAFERAQIALKEGSLDEARLWALRSIAAEKKERLKGRLNLLGRIELVAKNYAAAESSARKALTSEGGPEEGANSLRLLGEVLTATGRPAQAREVLLRALETDKKLGKSSKIAADLAALAAACEAANQQQEAIGYYERACDVQLGMGQNRQAANALKRAALLYQSLGQKEAGVQAISRSESLVQ